MKKKRWNPIRGSGWRKIFFMMRVTLFFLLAGLLQVSASVYSQQTKLNLKVEKTNVSKVLKMIEDQSDFHFLYRSDNLKGLPEVTFDFKDARLEDVLNKVIVPYGFTFEIDDRTVVIKRASIMQFSNPAEQKKEISGTVKDSKRLSLPGVTIVVKGTTVGTITDNDGKYSLSVPVDAKIMVFSFVGMKTQEISIASKTSVNVIMEEITVGVDEVVVVGYGTQKRESIIGAISNTTNESLEKRGGVVNLASALSGQIPGVMVMERTGEPGREDPLILIRGQATWNGSGPLILVDGVERRMNDLNVNEVESISVLKDASATAVFGVKGANGVVLVTSKRGKLGKAKLSMSANFGIKDVSKIFTPAEAFTAQSWKNAAIEREISSSESVWQYYLPYEQLLRSKKPQQYPYLYPNVDWKEEILKPFATNKQYNVNVSGGTEFAKYFASIAYTNEGDLLKSGQNNKGYDPEYSYNRVNFRGNLDFQLTKTTKLATNISGYSGVKNETSAASNGWIFCSLYTLAPDAFPVRYEDGLYGKDPADAVTQNPLAILNEAGVKKTNRLFLGTDFKLEQQLDMITKGLSAKANLSYDNYFGSDGPGINDNGNQGQTLYKYVSPSILDAKTHSDSLNAVILIPSASAGPVNEYDFVMRPWGRSTLTADNNTLQRILFYQLSLNYARTFGKHDVSAMALFSRRKSTVGANFPGFQEDWVSRVTYAYNNKYFGEVNGAYNGSEKFGPGYRFGFFPSVAVGWLLSEEHFLKYDWLNKLKLRGSIGKVGSDAGIPRWGYVGSWTSGGYALVGNANGITNPISAMQSPYTFYSEGTIANADINWETAIKKNIGLEISVLNNMMSFEADLFQENRNNIFMSGLKRNIPVYFGASPVPVNLGKTRTNGIELDFNFRKKMDNGISYWFRESMTRAKDVVLKAEDPILQDDYLKTVGFQIGQTKTQIRDGSIASNWDEVYAQTSLDDNSKRLTGDWGIIDFNGDGKINAFDNTAYGYSDNHPGNTFSTTIGFGYKNFNVMVQFYGVTNITQAVGQTFPSIGRKSSVSSYLVDYWSKENQDASYMAPRLSTTYPLADFEQFDGSYLRLKTAEISYNLPVNITKSLGLTDMRIYVNGNNLFFWSKLPMDDESGDWDVYNAYPTYRLFNIGVDVVF